MVTENNREMRGTLVPVHTFTHFQVFCTTYR